MVDDWISEVSHVSPFSTCALQSEKERGGERSFSITITITVILCYTRYPPRSSSSLGAVFEKEKKTGITGDHLSDRPSDSAATDCPPLQYGGLYHLQHTKVGAGDLALDCRFGKKRGSKDERET